MRILLIRHGDPDYENDTLTEKGWREAQLLADRISQMDVDHFYVSPLGRAQDTASCTLRKMERTAETLPWLEEVSTRIWRPDIFDRMTRIWDWLPQDWTKEDVFFDKERWTEQERLADSGARQEYDTICAGFDSLLAKHGYVHEGHLFHVTKSNHDTICLFCHFGVEMVILSHILEISPMILWHGFVSAPTGVTILHSEERIEGTAIFRIAAFSDTAHLYVGNEPVSFKARYAECYEDDTQH